MADRVEVSNIKKKLLIYLAIFFAGACSIVYELLISSSASYFLGNTIQQFSVIIGVYLAAMGIGAYLCKFIKHLDITLFIKIELLIGLIGGLAVPFIFFLYPLTEHIQYIIFLFVVVIGILTGTEIPILSSIMSEFKSVKTSLSEVLSVDYIGALIATILFPFLLLPFLGIFKSSIVTGLINVLLACVLFVVFKKDIRSKTLFIPAILSAAILITTLIGSGYLEHQAERNLYEDRIIHAEESRFQKIVLTKSNQDTRLYLNGSLQFSSQDEYRYHEVLVHYPVGCLKSPSLEVLILGGGDGLAAKELLKHQKVRKIDLVELDPQMIDLAKSHPAVKTVNANSLENDKVNVIVANAFDYIDQTKNTYDLIVVDLPDPKNLAINKLYTKSFYYRIQSRLKSGGIAITQATSPYFARSAFWCISNTIDQVFPHLKQLHNEVPSFGNWGFVMASNQKIDFDFDRINSIEYAFFSEAIAPTLSIFSKDIGFIPTKINTLINPVLINYYSDEWKKW